ncbi:type II toxin-antitoxin system ParD family antitoxin [Rhizobium alvei]|uniref:Type II toxin-antitoxin system ParD family antitoxin n=1 Tax=Rhizobium alvei TaxID=1132659 RepID=A0ABT8YFH5_9HYPH|nr:type II toxin-antitoxin system ParD family antitoxin [Rhizobium alvei]MDO6962450.1 type II toxin-antitoxin system ParD family antitoxin [Rhizobium alvei]
MPTVENLSIALTAEQADLLRQAVESGEYANASDVVRDAMHVWQEKREAREADVQKMGQLWDEGIASGKAQPMDFSELRDEARNRLREAIANGR